MITLRAGRTPDLRASCSARTGCDGQSERFSSERTPRVSQAESSQSKKLNRIAVSVSYTGMSLLLAAVLALIGVQGTPPAGTASVEGVVTKAGTSQPVANASVVIWWSPFSPNFEATTDGNGHFIVSNMPAGNFHIEVKAEGYLPYPLPDRPSFIGLRDGQHLRQDVVLSATSSISGRIVDDNREP